MTGYTYKTIYELIDWEIVLTRQQNQP